MVFEPPEGFEDDKLSEALSLDGLTAAFARAMGDQDDDATEEGAPSPESADNQSAIETDTSDGGSDESTFSEEDAFLIEEPDHSTKEMPVTPRGILEAMLFVDNDENRPLIPAEAAKLMRGVEPSEILDWIAELNHEYRVNRRPYEIRSVGGGYRLVLRETFKPVRDRFYGKVRESRLSQAAIDVLAIVAYRQPITAEEINRLRDKPSGPLLNQLVRRRLLRLERPESTPRNPRYWTTDRFLEIFGLRDLKDLPQAEEAEPE